MAKTVKTEAEIFKEEFKKKVRDEAKMLYRKTLEEVSDRHKFVAVAYAVKDIVIDQWIATQKAYEKADAKTVYYLSMEFLMGRALGNMIINLSSRNEIKEAIEELGLDLNVIEDQEPDAALGNGGLGRLAACFLDSLSTLGYPAYGCGIRYKYGMFQQKIENGYQKEIPEDWLRHVNPLEIKREEYACEVKFGGFVRVEHRDGRNYFIQEGYQAVRAIPYDMPIVGYGNNVVNTLRIWDAEPIVHFNLDEFDKGAYMAAVEQENLAKTITEVLYPNDNHYAGKELRLKQQYFFISASVQRAVQKFKEKHDDIHQFPEKVVFQLNDTHPTVAIPELMRILLDDEGLTWEEAWDITTRTCAYTNHTIMSEALEKWPVDLFSRLLPRIYQIVEEINRRFVNEIQQRYPGDQDKIAKMAVVYNGQVRMAYMAIVAGFSVNGVARLHTEILKHEELKDFYEMMPEKFNNKTKLQQDLGLAVDKKKYMIGLISRLTDQKGLDLINHVIEGIVDDFTQLVVIGTGDPQYENMFRHYAWKYPDRVSANICYSDDLAHKLYAAADAFLMPSRFEPCGLTQLISFRYGTVPIVRETGGLKDTVKPYNEYENSGDGFSFSNYNADEMLAVINYSKHIFFDKKREWNQIVDRGMANDFSWNASKFKYEGLYNYLIGE